MPRNGTSVLHLRHLSMCAAPAVHGVSSVFRRPCQGRCICSHCNNCMCIGYIIPMTSCTMFVSLRPRIDVAMYSQGAPRGVRTAAGPRHA